MQKKHNPFTRNILAKSRSLAGSFSIRPRSGVAAALTLPVLLVLASTSGTARTDTTQAELEGQFAHTVKPFLQTYCVSCHGKDMPQAQLDLSAYGTMASVSGDFSHWSRALDKLAANQMPPTAAPQPSEKQRLAVIAWIRAVRQFAATQNAGDPGPVLARRLSNAEYDYTIRDLTGQDLHPTREFPVDPANQEGFDNSGESLTFDSALLKKYAQAAKEISDHVVLTSTGLEFASHPVVVDTDRDKFSILRIVDFYKRQPTDYADYFYAAWRYKHRAALGGPNTTLDAVARRAKVSPRYLELVWNTLTTPTDIVGPIAKLQTMWNALPDPASASPEAARADCVKMRDWVVPLRKKLAWTFYNLKVPRGFSVGGQCFVLAKDNSYASHRRSPYPLSLQPGGVPQPRVVPAIKRDDKTIPEHTVTDPVDPNLFVPADTATRAPYLASFDRFCSVFPDTFYIAQRGRMFIDNNAGDTGRFLSAGLHNSMGYFRDDKPLMELLLDSKDRERLDQLWMDFDMVAYLPERMHREFYAYERAESGTMMDPMFNALRAEDKDATSDAKIKQLGDLYMAKARRSGAEWPAIEAISDHFLWVSDRIRAAERARLAAEPVQLRSLMDFAQRAYRRPLTDAERTDLLSFYQALRQKDGLSHEDAIRDTVASILLSPDFLFRMDLGDSGDGFHPADRARAAQAQPHSALPMQPTKFEPPVPVSLSNSGDQPLSDFALANKLSYFLWSSMPDQELLAHAAAGDLHQPEVLQAQAHRMLRDPKVRALALEFVGNWLDFRRFEELNTVDRNRFPAFTDDLRESMFEEPLHFVTNVYQTNGSVLDMVYGTYTFVNAPLARHYGMTTVKVTGDNWVRVNDADWYGRGGLLPMAVFLTKNSPGLRTSPVKRGYWVVRRLLGEYIPPPPPTVPALPSDESKLGNLTLREALVEHRKNPACASCHARFDSYGLVFEGYGPTGELRTTDMGGKPVDMSAPFPGGKERYAVAGLQAFIRQQRQQDFVDTLCRKLLSYALERGLQPTDDSTLLQMRQRLTAGGYRFDALVDSIVTSRQFCNRRALTTVARN